MAENVIDWTMTNWITILVMVFLGFMFVFILIALYTKVMGVSGGSANGTQAP